MFSFSQAAVLLEQERQKEMAKLAPPVPRPPLDVGPVRPIGPRPPMVPRGEIITPDSIPQLGILPLAGSDLGPGCCPCFGSRCQEAAGGWLLQISSLWGLTPFVCVSPVHLGSAPVGPPLPGVPIGPPGPRPRGPPPPPGEEGREVRIQKVVAGGWPVADGQFSETCWR